MLNKVLAVAARWAVGNKVLAGLAWVNDKLKGNRSELLILVLAVVKGLELAGLLDAKTGEVVLTALVGALPVTLAEKVNNVVAAVNKVVPERKDA